MESAEHRCLLSQHRGPQANVTTGLPIAASRDTPEAAFQHMVTFRISRWRVPLRLGCFHAVTRCLCPGAEPGPLWVG